MKKWVFGYKKRNFGFQISVSVLVLKNQFRLLFFLEQGWPRVYLGKNNVTTVYLAIYLLSRLQGLSQKEALDAVQEKYVSSLFANWKIWTLPQIININLVEPQQYRVLFANLLALVWNFYLASAKKK